MIADLARILLDVVTPVAVCAGIGFIWAKMKQPFDSVMVTRLVSNVGVPSLVFATLVKMELGGGLFLEMALAAFVTSVFFFVIGWAALKITGLSIRTYLNPVAFANTGNMGLPLCLLAFGEDGLALGIAYFVVNVVLLLTVGIAVASNQYNLFDVVKRPFIYAVLAASIFHFTDVEVPNALLSTTTLLGNFSIPLMLITLGVSLATLQIVSIKRAAFISFLRLGIGIPVGFASAAMFGFTGAAHGTLVLMCSMPVAVITFLFAENYGADGRAVAGAVIISTLASFAIMPVLLWFLMG
ncbi:MAG: AEC family transporter [Rhodospirillales bacterium]|nr:AEC family transporter [Rhodospirillales bacterium]MBO6787423.1 AEC family transporter [Rhodospirillales bacterium]